MSLRLCLIMLGAVALLGGAAGLYWKGRFEGAARERPKIEAARAQAVVAGLETRGERATAQRVEVIVRQREIAERAVAQVTQQALKSEDAGAPLDPDRRARLLAADGELCRAAPGLTGCTQAGDAGASPAALRVVPPSGGGDAG